MQKSTVIDIACRRADCPGRMPSVRVPSHGQNGSYQRSVRQDVESGASLSVLRIEQRRVGPHPKGNCYASRNAVRGLIYALLPSAVLWAIMIGIVYTILKR